MDGFGQCTSCSSFSRFFLPLKRVLGLPRGGGKNEGWSYGGAWGRMRSDGGSPTMLPFHDLSGSMKKTKNIFGLAIPFSRGSSQPRDQTRISCIAGIFFTV